MKKSIQRTIEGSRFLGLLIVVVFALASCSLQMPTSVEVKSEGVQSNPVGSSIRASMEDDDDDECEDVEGPFQAAVVPPPPGGTCTSPVGLCTSGVLEGDLEGTYAFTATSFLGTFPVDEFTGESVIELEDGDFLFGSDLGNINFETGDFVTNISITGGTGDFEGASGILVATGVSNLALGIVEGDYTGSICSPDDEEDDDEGDDD